MKNLAKATQKFLRNEEGVTAIEYGLIAALIALVIIATLILVGTDLNTVFVKIEQALAKATT
ncbi:MAG TPA: Flp family type IVb pilin [Moraxellaceae bacterium]|nr:Flp family type IVb pilin [Moraxellaceae bacterium]